MNITLEQSEVGIAVKEYIKKQFGVEVPKVELTSGRGANSITATINISPDIQFSIGSTPMTKLADKPCTNPMPFTPDPVPVVEPTPEPVVEPTPEPVVPKEEPLVEAEPVVDAAPAGGLFANAAPPIDDSIVAEKDSLGDTAVEPAAATTADNLFPTT